jgi:TonB family protein
MPAPVPEQASTREADQELIQLFRSGYKEAEETKPETAKKTNWKLIGGLCAGAVVIVLAILIPMEMRGKPANSSSTSVPSVAAAASVDQGAGAPKPSPSAPVTVPVRANTTPQSTTTSSQQASYNNEEASAPAVQSQLMSDQLNAPRRIPKGANTRVPDEAPPPAGNLDGLGGSGSIGNAFNDGSKSKIRLASVPVSAGIAGGMLIRRFPPVYPSIAKAAHVSGTVVLAATISKSGTIQNLRVVSGPAMLRQAAVEAVQKWVYRPYLLDNQPTEMDTTIDVDFSQ